MKKYAWIVALLAALSLAIFGIGCGGGGGDDDEGDKEGPKVFDLELKDNYQYGHGYQATFTTGDYFTGKITKGDQFTISFKVKTSRDLEDALTVGLVDPTPEAYKQYWGPLTWDGDNGDPDSVGPKKGETPIKAGDEITFTMEWTASASASSAKADANHIVFQTSGLCDKADCADNCDRTKPRGVAGAGKAGSVKLSFTDFTLTRKGEANIETCPDCGKPLDECECPPPFDFKEIIGALKAGDESNGYDGKLGTFITGGGNPEIKVLDDKTIQVLSPNSWGDGIDLKAMQLKFKAGDKIKVTGKVLGAVNVTKDGDKNVYEQTEDPILLTFIYVGMDGTGENKGVIVPTQLENKTDVAAKASFVNEVTLTATDISNLDAAANDPYDQKPDQWVDAKAQAFIRIGVKGDGTAAAIIISNIEIIRAK